MAVAHCNDRQFRFAKADYGHKPSAIAAARGISAATVRAQLKANMAKAHSHSQHELIHRIGQLVMLFR